MSEGMDAAKIKQLPLYGAAVLSKFCPLSRKIAPSFRRRLPLRQKADSIR